MGRVHVRGERKKQQEKSKPKVIFGWAFQIVIVIVFAYLLVYFFGQIRTNVGQSMDLALAGGDKVFINTISYKLGGPARNDVIAFKPNGSTSSHTYIKRVIGLPGETIQIKDGMIYINDQIYMEKTSYPSINNPGLAEKPITLGTTEYFVLGDNRNNSDDSRYADIGNVNLENIEGKVWLRVSPFSRFGTVK